MTKRKQPPKTKAEPTDDRLNAATVPVWETLRNTPPAPPFSPRAGIGEYRSWVSAAANINAQAVASVPLRLYVKKRAGQKCLFNTRPIGRKRMAWLRGDADVSPSRCVLNKAASMGEMEEVIDEHPLTTLLQNVNPLYNGFDFSVWRILCQELTGNAYTLMIRSSDNDPPEELWPLMPQYTSIIPSRTDWIAGYHYERGGVGGVQFERQDVIHFRQPSLTSMYYGMGKVERAWGVVQNNNANHEMDRALAVNHARPDYAVLMEGATADQTVRMQADLDRRLKGTHKAGRSLVMGGPKITLQPLNFPPKDMAGRVEVVEEIAAVFGVPVSMLKANDPNLASAKAGYGQWREATILPLCRMDEQALNQQLVPLYSEDLMLAYDNPVPSDEAFAVDRRMRYVAGAVITPNEARVEEGYEPVDDGMADMLLVNGQPLGMASMLGGFGAAPAEDAEMAMADDADNAADAADTEPAAPAGDAGIAADNRISGADAERAVAMCATVSDGTGNPEVVRIALVGMGFTQEQADAMVAASVAFKPKEPEDDPDAGRNPDVPVPDPDVSAGGGTGGDDDDGDMEDDEGGKEGADGVAADGEDEERNGKSAGQGRLAGDGRIAAAARNAEVIDLTGEPHQREISHKAMANGCDTLGCDCHGEKPRSIDATWDTYRKAVGNAPERDEPENPLAAYAKRMGVIFGQQRSAVVGVLANQTKKYEELLEQLNAELAKFNDEIERATRPFLQTMVGVGGNVGADTVNRMRPGTNTVFDVTNPDVGKFLDAYTVRLRKEVQGYTGEQIAATVKRELDAGSTPADLARALQDDASAAGGSLSPSRAEAIARTESARAYVEGERKAWGDSGVVQAKQWLLAPDACEFCQAVAAQFASKQVGLDEPFFKKGATLTVGGAVMRLDYSDVQGPPLHPNDRCDLVPVME